jgi:hypothetical protein
MASRSLTGQVRSTTTPDDSVKAAAVKAGLSDMEKEDLVEYLLLL